MIYTYVAACLLEKKSQAKDYYSNQSHNNLLPLYSNVNAQITIKYMRFYFAMLNKALSNLYPSDWRKQIRRLKIEK